MEKIEKLNPLKCMCVTVGNLPTAYFESMSYYEQLTWFCNYLEKTVIPAINNNANAVEELQELYITVKNYVDNYFDNLNIQEEVNNKIDELVSNGTMDQLLNTNLTGQLSDLQTTDKSSLVNAINEVNSEIIDGTQYNRRSYTYAKEVAHRGAPLDTIENTITSFEYAYNQGFEYFETDIQLTYDGNFVLFHDKGIDGKLNGTGYVNNLTYSYLRGLTYISGGNISNYPNTQISDLDELLDFLKSHKIKCFLEIKETWTNEKLAELYETIKNAGLLQSIIFVAFNVNYLEYLRSLNNKLPMVILTQINETTIQYAKTHDFIIGTDITYATDELVSSAHENDLSVYAWTVNQLSDFQTLLNNKVDYIVTNSLLYDYPSTTEEYTTEEYSIKTFSKYEEYLIKNNRYVLEHSTAGAVQYGRALYTKFFNGLKDHTVYALIPSKYKIAIQEYDSNNTLQNDSGWLDNEDLPYTLTDDATVKYYLYFKKSDDSFIYDYELNEIGKLAQDHYYI